MDYVDKDFGKILKNNAQTLRHELLPLGTDCFRVYDRNLERYPVTVDLYGKYAKVTDYGTEPLSEEEKASCLDICSRMLYLEPDNVVYAVRARRPDRAQHEKTELEALRTTVHENGHSFIIDLTTYVDTGLFLDHAVTRRMIGERCSNADVLNLFSYTGSFSVYAAAGGANSVTSVDMSATYTKWAEQNLAENGYNGSSYKCVCKDAEKFVEEALTKGLKYDIIIFDPPSFSNSRKMEHDFDVARDWVYWIKSLLQLLKKTGFILFSTNLGSFQMDRRKLRGLSIKEITGAVWAPGFVKGRPGTVRSWMMAFDDESLTLDWSEPEKKSEKGSGTQRRTTERRNDTDRRTDRKPSYGKSSYNRDRSDRPRYDRDRSDRRPRYDEDRPRRYSDDRRQSDRPYNGDRKPRTEGSYERRDRYERNDRRDNGYERSDRYERTERPRYDREDRGTTERRSYDRRDRYDRDDRPRERRSYDNRSYDNREERSERRPRYDEDRPRQSRDRASYRREEGSYERRERTGSKDNGKAKKPYGYDSFKPARSRDDNPDFFWNAEDLDPKKEN